LHNFEVLESFVELFAKRKNRLGIFLNTVGITRVRYYMCGE